MTKEWLGVWWRADSDAKVGGQLVLDEGGPKLVLFGSFFDWSDFDFTRGVGFGLNEPQTVAVIHGRTIEPVSVLNARCDFPVPPGAEGFEAWYADAIVGAEISAPSPDVEPTFTGIRLQLESLPAWSRARRIERRVWFDRSRTELVVEPHKLAAAVLPSGERVEIEQHAVASEEARQYRIRQPVSIRIENTAPATWTELLNQWLQPIQVLLWLATAKPSRVEQMELRVDGPDEVPTKWARLWASLVEPNVTGDRDLHPRDVLFHVDDLPGGFGQGLTRWLTVWTNLRHVIGPLYARASAPFTYANDRFYTAAAAIEAYHRYCVDSERDLLRQDHRHRVERLDQLLSEHAPDLRDWAVNAVRPFNRVPYWRRIVEICERLPALSHDLCESRLQVFAKAVEDARHGHAHALHGSRLIESGSSLYVTADALVWILRACVMIDLGFPPDDTQERVRRNKRFKWTSRRLTDVFDSADT